jgi:hypothetical protein
VHLAEVSSRPDPGIAGPHVSRGEYPSWHLFGAALKTTDRADHCLPKATIGLR